MRYPFVYISDVKDLPPESRELLLAAEIDCMVVDALFREKHFSHFSLGEALSLIREVSHKRFAPADFAVNTQPYGALGHRCGRRARCWWGSRAGWAITTR